MFSKTLSILIIVVSTVAIIMVGCSKNGNPSTPALENDKSSLDVNSFQQLTVPKTDNRKILAVYDMTIDPVLKTCELKPSSRQGSYHFPLNAYFPNVLKITGFGWTPTFWADMKLSHPFPGSGIDAFDPRIIALLPCTGNNNFSYPILDAYGNHAVVLEPDGYTKLFDNLNPSISGTANPFKAYFKSQNYRVWSSTGYTSETQRWYLNLFGFDGPIVYTLVVDVSTNYPNPPTPIVDNAQDPVQIQVTVGDGLTPEGGEADISVVVMDWQGMADLIVVVECPPLFDGLLNIPFYGSGPGDHLYEYRNSIKNFLLAPEGDYGVMVSVFDDIAGFETYYEGVASVKPEVTLNPIDITPNSLNFSPQNVYIDNSLAYIAAGYNGLHIFDITNPNNPIWLKKVNIDGNAVGLIVGNGYALVCAEEGGLVVVDVDPIGRAHVVATEPTQDYALDIDAWAGYAYIADDYAGLSIVSIGNPGAPSLIGNVYLGGRAIAVKIAGEYAFIANDDLGCQIVNVGNPENPYLINTVYTGGIIEDIAVWGGYAFITNWEIAVVDIYPPESAYWINEIDVPGRAHGICIDSGIAYVAGWDGDFYMVDASTPYGNVFNQVWTPGDCDVGVHVSGGIACDVDDQAGLHLIDVSNPNYPYRTSTIYTPGNALGAFVDDEGYAYIADGYAGLMSVDVDPPTPQHVMAHGNTPGEAMQVCVDNGYLYVADNQGGLVVFMMTSPGIFEYVTAIDTGGQAFDVCVENGYLYLADGIGDLDIFNVVSPQNIYYVGTAYTMGMVMGVDVNGSYAYVADDTGGFQIINVVNPASPFIEKTLTFPYWHAPRDVVYKNGYAYVADYGAAALKVIDVDPISTADVVSSVYFTDEAMNVFVKDNYAYVACWDAGLQIVDITNPQSISITASVPTIDAAWSVFVDGIYAYVADCRGGLRIIQVWQ